MPVEAVDGQRVGPPVARGLGPVARDPGLAEEGDPGRRAVGGAPRPVALGQPRDRRHVALGVGEPAVGPAGRAVEALRRVGADPDLGARERERPRRDAHRRQAQVAALVGEGLAREGRVEDVQHLVEHLGAAVVGHAEGGEVHLLVADAQAQHQPPAGEVVEHDRVLGQAHRVVQRPGQHGGADPDARGLGGQVGQHQQRRDDRPGPARLVELGQQDGVEARRRGRPGLGRELVEQARDVALGPGDRQHQAVPHRATRGGRPRRCRPSPARRPPSPPARPSPCPRPRRPRSPGRGTPPGRPRRRCPGSAR